jgi:hypothetical protein
MGFFNMRNKNPSSISISLSEGATYTTMLIHNRSKIFGVTLYATFNKKISIFHPFSTKKVYLSGLSKVNGFRDICAFESFKAFVLIIIVGTHLVQSSGDLLQNFAE